MINKILKEINRLKKELNGYSALEALDYIEAYINTLPEESGCEVNFTIKSEDLKEEITKCYKSRTDINEPSLTMINELRQLTGAGMMTCKVSLLKLVEALKQKPIKMDVNYEIKINWEKHPYRAYAENAECLYAPSR